MRTVYGMLFAIATGCGGNDATTPTGTTISSTGGSVTVADGSGVSIPAGALSMGVAIGVVAASSPPSPTGTLVGTIYTFSPEGQQFGAAATVTLAIDPAKLPSGKTASDVTIVTAPLGSSSYTTLATTVVDATHVSAPTMHFSNFAPTIPTSGGTHCSTNADCSTGVCAQGVCAQ